MRKSICFYLLVLLVFVSCLKSERNPDDSVKLPKYQSQLVTVEDTVESELQNGMAVKKIPVDTIRFTTSTHPQKSIAKTTQPDASLVYYCPNRMLEHTDNNVSVTITRAAMSEALELLAKRIEATTGKSQEAIRNSVAGTNIKLANKMKVELKYSAADFETIYKPENDDQIFDGENDMNWDWIIKPTRVGSVQLSIIVSAFDERNGRWIAVQTPPRIFNIKIQVDPRSYFSKLWGFLETNPEWILVQILFPIIAFFYGKRKGKKKKKTIQ